ncbi:MAG: heme-binding domain-containing protein [Saprospiraceae bacterium]|nr:heme-binding domain-containing protein [Saprospiraceae bacterium]
MKLKRKYILPVIGVLLILIQLFRIDKTNPPVDEKLDFVATMNPSEEIGKKIVAACYDCHSYTSEYPWYTNVAPVSWWIKGHINGGRKHLNFSIWNEYSDDKKNHKLEECVEVMENGWMPLGTYTWLHPDAKLSDQERKDMIAYFKSI